MPTAVPVARVGARLPGRRVEELLKLTGLDGLGQRYPPQVCA